MKTLFERDTEDQKCVLLQEFFNFKHEKGSNISLHMAKLENLAFRLKAVQRNVDDTWNSTPTNEKTLTKLAARLMAEEAHLQGKEEEISISRN
ncbi:hypothetical protein QE152_g37932 [Popillia japonica]|uniref:Uncharacterized protein n=1 Tax=Popillia japonica TaxID=7064 RepID=A0AAW1I8T6_POPJA